MPPMHSDQRQTCINLSYPSQLTSQKQLFVCLQPYRWLRRYGTLRQCSDLMLTNMFEPNPSDDKRIAVASNDAPGCTFTILDY